MKKILITLLMAIPLLGLSQIKRNRDGFEYFIFGVNKEVPFTSVIDEVAETVSDYGYSYFSTVKTKKRSYTIGSFDNLLSDRFVIVVYKENPEIDCWKVVEVEYYDFEEID